MKNLIVLILLIGLAGAGYYYYVRQPKDIATVQKDINTAKDTVVSTANTSIDTATQSALKGVGTVSPIYYLQNRNYGISASQNICNDTTNAGSLGNIISQIQKYTKMVSCIPASDFPSRSFTITVESKVNPGKYFCTDQGGQIDLIPSISPFSTFREGVKCK